MKSVQTKVTVPTTSSRKEILVRLVYWIPLLIVLYILNIIGMLCWLGNLFSVLLRRRVSVSLASVQKTMIDYTYKFQAYYSFLTDERPPIIPEPN